MHAKLAVVSSLLFGSFASAADIPAKQEVLNRVVKPSVAKAIKTLVDEMPSKYELKVTTQRMDEVTNITIKGDPFAIAVIQDLFTLHSGETLNRGERLKQVVELERRRARLGSNRRRHEGLEVANRELQLKGALDALRIRHKMRREGRWQEAIPFYEQTHAVQSKFLGADDPQTMRTLFSIGEMYSLSNQPDAAEPYLAEFVAYARENERNHLLFSSALSHLSGVYLELGRLKAAEDLARETLAIKVRGSPNHWSVGSSKTNLGACLLAQGRFDEAEPLLVDGHNWLKKNVHRVFHPERLLPRSAQRLVTLYMEWNKPAETIRWRAELARINEEYPSD